MFNPAGQVQINIEQVWKGLFIVALFKTMAKAAGKKAARKARANKNKLGVKNSLVNNINARKKKGKLRSKQKSTVSKKSYEEMEDNWGRKNNS